MATSRTKLKNEIYRSSKELTSRIYNDDFWLGVTQIKNRIAEAFEKTGFIGECVFSGGNYKQNGDSQWKEYDIEINNQNGDSVIAGKLYCSAAGTIDYPFSRYDLSLCLDLV